MTPAREGPAMQRIAFKAFLTAMTAASVVWSSASAQGQTPAACSLLSNADVERVTGRHLYTDPDQASLADAGSACTFNIAQVILFSGDRSEERWTAYVKRWGHGEEPRLPVSGVGDRAYVFYPKPRTSMRACTPSSSCGSASTRSASRSRPRKASQPSPCNLRRSRWREWWRRSSDRRPGLSLARDGGSPAARSRSPHLLRDRPGRRHRPGGRRRFLRSSCR